MTGKLTRLTNQEISTFLEALVRYPTLWNRKLPEYNYKFVRDKQLRLLLADLEKMNLKMNEEEFRVRFKSVKDTYRKELRKVVSCRKHVPDPEKWYYPRLVWYEQADSFLADSIRGKMSPTNGDDSADNSTSEAKPDDDDFEIARDLDTFNRRLHDNDSDDDTKDDITPYQRKNNDSIQRSPVQNSQKIKRSTSPLSREVREAIKHLDGVISNMKKLDEIHSVNDEFGRYVTTQLDFLSPAWSVVLRTEIQNAISKVVLQSLSAPEPEANSNAISDNSLDAFAQPSTSVPESNTTKVVGTEVQRKRMRLSPTAEDSISKNSDEFESFDTFSAIIKKEPEENIENNDSVTAATSLEDVNISCVRSLKKTVDTPNPKNSKLPLTTNDDESPRRKCRNKKLTLKIDRITVSKQPKS